MKSVLLAVALALAACSGGGVGNPSPEPADADVLGVLAYDYQPGQRLEYRVDLTQHLTATGTSSLTAEEQDSADVTSFASGLVRYDVAEGPEPGLVEIDISGDFDQVETTGTFNGRPIETPKDITPFAPEVEEPNRDVVVDEFGRPWRSEDGPSGLNPLWLLNPRFAAFDPLESPLGPLFDGSELEVGAAWTVIDETYVTDQAVVTTYDFVVDAVAESNGSRIATISFTSNTSGFTVDFADTVQDLLSFLGRGGDDDTRLTITAAPGTAEGVVSFDVDAGLVVSQATTTTYAFDVDAMIPLDDFAEADIVLAGEIRYTADRVDVGTG